MLNIRSARTFEPYLALENRQMLADLASTPGDFFKHIRRYATSQTTVMTYGWRGPTYDDQRIQRLFEVLEEFLVLSQTGTSALIEYFPWARVLPKWMMGPVQGQAEAHHRREKAMYLGHWSSFKDEMKRKVNRPCFCATLYDEQLKRGFSDELACYIAGSLLEAGADTTASTLYGFVQAMILFPEVQREAQREIDQVIGSERLPTSKDDLPYVRACVKESVRWMPTAILGAAPHASTREDLYAGYRIPKGAALINNVYTIHHDSERYPDPRTFNPERYTKSTQTMFEAAMNPDVSQRDHFTFGAGRRLCPGIHIAEQSLFLAIASILWA
ncbi:MAG: hypothetical protein MMC23_008704 [Stictis urceolatum]|nr:hypothetical protein [Stictis urceolata]